MALLYQRHGGVGLNAATGKDLTRYMISLPANRLPLWAALEADRMAHPVLREFYKERGVVMEERRLRNDDSPSGLLFETFTSAAFRAHPYGIPTIGWESDILSLTPADTEAFFKAYYGPGNATIAIVGDINPKDVMTLIEQTFGTIPASPSQPPIVTVEPPQRGERRVEVEFDAEPSLVIGFHKPALGHPDDYVFDVIDALLSDGLTSRLYTNLVREKRIAASVNSDSNYPGVRSPNLFVVNATPLAPHTTAEVEAAIYAEIERLKTEPVSAKELEKVLNNLDADLVRALRSNGGLASQLALYQTVAGDWRYALKSRDKIAAVTPLDIQRVASCVFHKVEPNGGDIGEEGRRKKCRDGAAARGGTMRDVKRETRNVKRWSVVLCSTIVAVAIPVLTACAGDLALGDPRQMTFKPVEFTPPEPDRVVFENGMVVYLLEDHELPLVSMTATMRTGSWLDPAEKIGLASLTGSVMRTGGGRRFVGRASGPGARTVRRGSRHLDRTAIRFCIARCAQQGLEAGAPDFRRTHSNTRL